MCAVFDNFVKRWWLYYISTDGQIKLIKGPEEGQLESKDLSTNPPYEPDSIDVSSLNLPAPNGGNSQLGVAEYLDNNGNPQVCSNASITRGVLSMPDSCLLPRR